jgi:DNA-binding transcriptional ArsR family regulator
MGPAVAAPEDEIFRALADPRRRAIIRLVARDEMAAGDIARSFDVTRTAVSQHLTLLKSAHLLTERREGTKRLYRADARGLTELRRALDEIWAASLDVGRRLVEQDRADRPTAVPTGASR